MNITITASFLSRLPPLQYAPLVASIALFGGLNVRHRLQGLYESIANALHIDRSQKVRARLKSVPQLIRRNQQYCGSNTSNRLYLRGSDQVAQLG